MLISVTQFSHNALSKFSERISVYREQNPAASGANTVVHTAGITGFFKTSVSTLCSILSHFSSYSTVSGDTHTHRQEVMISQKHKKVRKKLTYR